MKRLLTMSAVGAACALALPLAAQNGLNFENTNVAGRVGAFFPFDSELSDLDDVWFQMGIDFEFQTGLFANATTVFSVDWMTRTGGARDNAFPLIVSQRWYSGSESGRRTYWQVGIGATASDFKPADLLFTARAGIGMEFGDRVFFEANVMWSDEDKGKRSVTGAAAFAGLRF